MLPLKYLITTSGTILQILLEPFEKYATTGLLPTAQLFAMIFQDPE